MPTVIGPLWRRFKRARVRKKLGEAYERCCQDERTIDLESRPLVVFSDHHKGDRDHADDFWRCEAAYNAALAYYLELGYGLVVLGDAEELWEEDAPRVLAAYERTLHLEGEFLAENRYQRVWGNHDPDWKSDQRVSEELLPALNAGGRQLQAREGLCLRVTVGGRSGQLFLAHGHQGMLHSGLLRPISEPAVRFGWARIQRRLRRGWNSPARDNRLRADHDQAMFEWAAARPEEPVLIAGHTHRPVFWVRDRPEPDVGTLEVRLAELREGGAPVEEIARQRSALEIALARRRTTPDLAPKEMERPCYFNTGCCSFADGSVTGIELTDDAIRLVRWPWPYGRQEANREVIDEAPLSEVLAAVRGTQ